MDEIKRQARSAIEKLISEPCACHRLKQWERDDGAGCPRCVKISDIRDSTDDLKFVTLLGNYANIKSADVFIDRIENPEELLCVDARGQVVFGTWSIPNDAKFPLKILRGQKRR